MHKSVLLNECLEYLHLQKDATIVDATLGFAGHSFHILENIPNGFLYAFDQDQQAICASQKRLENCFSNFEIIQSNFCFLKEELAKRGVAQVDGILFDLGVSSPQLDEAERGFSFHKDAPLDMRMDEHQSLSAYEVVNEYSYEQLVSIFYRYGEEKYAPSIAKKIVRVRETKKIATTLELAELIKESVPLKYRREKHPARKVFQAIRIEVNKELDVFEKALKDSLDLLSLHGRICVITFHSLEDKICKEIFNQVSKVDDSLKKLPVLPKEYLPKFQVIANIKPSEKEIIENHRARSARLRVIERIG